jgi:acetyl-CoA carboxylase biotin carboxyl carrier protein
MDQKEIQELIKLVSKSDISEIKIKDKDFSIVIRNKNYGARTETTVVPVVQAPVAAPVVAAPQPVAAAAPAVAESKAEVSKPAETSTDNANYVTFKSPMVGTFYRKPSPDKDVFVKVGDKVKAGDVLCIIEAMKLFNEIESEVSGTIVKVLADDSSPVEYDQPLFLIDPA